MIIIAGTIRIDPENRDGAIAATQDVMVATAREEGCVSYVFSSDFSDPGLFHLFEEWETAEALEDHFSAPHLAVFREQLGNLGVIERSLNRYQADNKAPLA